MLCVMKNVKQVLRVSVDSSLSMSRWDKFGIHFLSSPKVAFSVFDVYICILSCLWRDDLKDQSSSDSESHLELYFPLPVHSVILRVVVILGTETFIVVTGIVSPSLSCGTAVRTCEDVPERRMLLWATWSSRVALTSLPL